MAGQEIGLEVTAGRTKYRVKSRDQNEGRSHNMKTENKPFERVEQFRYLGTALTDRNSIQKEIKDRLKSENACCHSVLNVLCSGLLSKNVKMNM